MPTVIYDHQIFSHQEFGGVSRYFCELASRIQLSPNWRVKVCAPLHYNRYLAESTLPTMGVFLPLASPKLGRLYAALNDMVGAPLLMAMRKNLIHQTYYGARPRNVKGPFIVTVFDMIHELLPQYFSRDDPVPRWKKALVESADHVICISRKTAADLVEVLGVAPEKISVTHLAYSEIFAATAAANIDSSSVARLPYLLYVGKRGGYKNFSRVLGAYASSAALRDNFDLVAFGGGAFTSIELARFTSLNLRRDALRHTTGDDAALARCYSGARAFVYPSEYEGFGIPPLEAMSSGCAVACSNASSLPEVVGTAGEYFEPTEVASIRSALENVALDDSRHAELVQAGHLRCRLFSWERCAAETLAIYEKVVDEQSPP